jgi:PilZ domain-containing protein
MNRDTRRSPRYPFVATAELVQDGSNSIMMARLGDLSLHGCFIHMSSPLGKGASVSIRIAVGNSVFQARGTVVHSEPNAGVGVEFQEIEPSYLAVLEEWLLEAKNLNTLA